MAKERKICGSLGKIDNYELYISGLFSLYNYEDMKKMLVLI